MAGLQLYGSLFVLCVRCVDLAAAGPVHHRGYDGRDDNTDWNRTSGLYYQLRHTAGEYELCDICLEGVAVVNHFISSGRTFDDVKPFATNLCVRALTAHGYHGNYMCRGIIESYGPRTWFIFVQLSLNPLTICEKLNFCLPSMDQWRTAGFRDTQLQGRVTSRGEKLPGDVTKLPDDITKLPDDITKLPDDITKLPDDITKLPDDITKQSDDVLRILQISDIHVDPYYASEAATHCGLFLCCRVNFNGTGSAGFYGDFHRCDLPVYTLDLVLSAIRKLDPAPDFIVYTGDSPPHDAWQESWAGQLRGDNLVVEKLSSQLKGFNIYPAIGNHESFPESFYYQPNADYQALNAKLATWWGSWFNMSADQRENIEKSAYYTTLVRPGLRILSFNTDYGYQQNFYFLLNDRIPQYREQLQFMRNVLMEARLANEKVIIIGHVPPGDKGSSTMEYGDFYTSLAVNYSDVISLHLFGHTHHDEFEVVIDPTTQKPFGPVFIAPSVTTYGEVNPGFRVYKLDARTFSLLDYEQYYLNITAANVAGKTEVKLFYSAKTEYGLRDMTAASWKSLSDRLKTDTELLALYRRNHLTGSGLEGSCDQSCRHSTWCQTTSASLRAYLNCLYELYK